MGKSRHIQKPNGQLAGSIGAGKSALPAEVGRPGLEPVTPITSDTNAVDSAWEQFRRTDQTRTPGSALEDIDTLSAQAVEAIMELRDEELTARTSLTAAGQARADELSQQAALLHVAVLRAREELLHARAHLEGAHTAPEIPGVRAVLDADLLAYEVTELASVLQERPEDASVVRANKHIEAARALMRRSLPDTK